jgi:hypothetical protein
MKRRSLLFAVPMSAWLVAAGLCTVATAAPDGERASPKLGRTTADAASVPRAPRAAAAVSPVPSGAGAEARAHADGSPAAALQRVLHSARIVGSSLSVSVEHPERWCSLGRSDSQADARVRVEVEFPREPGARLVPALLVIGHGVTEIRQPVGLGARRFTLTSDTFRLPARIVCANPTCVAVRLLPQDERDAERIDTRWHRTCTPGLHRSITPRF